MSKSNLKRLPALEVGELAADALALVAEFLWLRPQELGRYMHPRDKHSRKYAEKYLRKLQTLRYVVARKLPGRSAGTAFVLSQRGADWLNEHGCLVRATPGTRWGEIRDGIWWPPATWKHDLWAIGTMFLLIENNNLDPWPEHKLRAYEPEAKKHPDGLLVGPNGCIWLEVENARKTGQNRRQMLHAIVQAARGTAVTNYPNTAPIKQAAIAFPADSQDLHGRKINHSKNLRDWLDAVGVKSETKIYFITMHLRGVGVERLSVTTETFLPKEL